MTDSKYFTTTKKGEIFELKSELNSDKKEKKKEAVKKVNEIDLKMKVFDLCCKSIKNFRFQVIASMTVGKDVSALFPDVVNCMQTDNLELKKLVYLYLMNYAKSQPDMAIMAVNTFVKVCGSIDPFSMHTTMNFIYTHTHTHLLSSHTDSPSLFLSLCIRSIYTFLFRIS